MKSFLSSWLCNPFRRAMRDLPWFGPAVSAVLIALTVNVLTETLTALGGPKLGWAAVLILFLTAFGVVYFYDRVQRRKEARIQPVDIDPPPPMPGLIFLGFRKETLEAALEHHQGTLKHCWLLTTPEVQENASHFVSQHPQYRFHLEAVSNAYSTEECYQVVRRIYQTCEQEARIPPGQVISDITGGTKPMTAGMVMACLEGGYPMEHIAARYGKDLHVVGPLGPIEIKVKRT